MACENGLLFGAVYFITYKYLTFSPFFSLPFKFVIFCGWLTQTFKPLLYEKAMKILV